MKPNISGVGVALVTPFDSDMNIDADSLEKLVEYVTRGGVDYLVALGTTAETPTLSDREKALVLGTVKKANRGRLPIVVGIGGNNTSEIIKTIKETDLGGVDAVLSVTPYYNRPTQEGLYCHYKSIAENSPLPVILYNVPSRTGVNLEPETTLRLARELPNVIAVKEACGNINQMMKLVKHRPEGFSILSGDDCLALPLLAIGGDGIISVAANAFPSQFSRMIKAYLSGDNKVAIELHNALTDVLDALFTEGNPCGVKTALSIKGICSESVRLPLVCGSGNLRERIESIMEAENL